MLRFSPPIGHMLVLGNEGAAARTEMLRRARTLGVDTMSVKDFPRWTDAEAKDARRFLDDNGLRIGEVVPFYHGRHLGSPDRALHKEALDSYARHLHIGAIVGAHCIGFGWGKEFNWASPDIWSQKTWDERVAGVAELAKVAEREGVDLAAHPLYYSPLNSVERYKDMIQRVGSPRLKILVDLVNLTLPHMYYNTTDHVNHVFDELQEHFVSLHAKDVKISGGGIGGGARAEKGNPIVHIDEAVPGTGVMDFHTIMKRLGKLEQDITLHVEHFDYEDTVFGQQYIRGVAREVGVEVG